MAEVGQNDGWAGRFQFRLSEYHIAE